MEDFSKLSDEDLSAIKLRKPAPNSTTREVDIEMQRRMQNKSLEQTATLVDEVKTLKEVVATNAETSERNSRSSHHIAKFALILAVVSTIFTILQVKIEVRLNQCDRWGDNGIALWEQCNNHFKFGAYEFTWMGNVRSLQ